MKAVGPALGFGAYAQSNVQGPDGAYQVPDPPRGPAIFGMRKDPQGERHDGGGFHVQQRGAACGCDRAAAAASGDTLDLFSDSPRTSWRNLFEG